jgi:hypothetical protein
MHSERSAQAYRTRHPWSLEQQRFSLVSVPRILASMFLAALPWVRGAEPVQRIPQFTKRLIPQLKVPSERGFSETKNDIRFDVFYNNGPKRSVAIYAVNTGRKQIDLTPQRHVAILESLVQKQFTVVIADFKDKQLSGSALERYVVQLTDDVRAVIDGALEPSPVTRPPLVPRAQQSVSRTETHANDYYTLMPGFTVERDIKWFSYNDIPKALRDTMAAQLGKAPWAESEPTTNTYDIIYPVDGPKVGVLTNYCSSEKGRQNFYATKDMHLVMSFAFKNIAIVHQQYFNDPIGGYHKGYDYYGDQFATAFIRHIKGNATRYQIDPSRIACFGHSKGSELPGMLVNNLRAHSPFKTAKADFKKTELSEVEKTILTPYAEHSTTIACAILGAGIANAELSNPKLMPWDNHPAIHVTPFFLYADHRVDTRKATASTVAKARENGVPVETAEMDAHTWPIGPIYDRASTFAERYLRPEY